MHRVFSPYNPPHIHQHRPFQELGSNILESLRVFHMRMLFSACLVLPDRIDEKQFRIDYRLVQIVGQASRFIPRWSEHLLQQFLKRFLSPRPGTQTCNQNDVELG